jgi:hypothetical protein
MCIDHHTKWPTFIPHQPYQSPEAEYGSHHPSYRALGDLRHFRHRLIVLALGAQCPFLDQYIRISRWSSDRQSWMEMHVGWLSIVHKRINGFTSYFQLINRVVTVVHLRPISHQSPLRTRHMRDGQPSG